MKHQNWTKQQEQQNLCEFYKEKYKEHKHQVKYYTEMQEQYTRLQERRKEPGFPYPNAYDTGDYTRELENAKHWLGRFLDENAEYLL